MLPHENAEERIAPVVFMSTNLFLKKSTCLNAKLTKYLEQIEPGPPPFVTTFTEGVLLFIEALGSFRFGGDELLLESRTQITEAFGS